MQTGHDTPEEPARSGMSPRRRRRPLLWTGLLLGLLLVLGAVMAVQALNARTKLTAAADAVAVLREQVTAGETGRAKVTAEQVREDAADARGSVHGPHWWLASKLPVAGPNVRAVQTVTEVVDDLASDAIPDLVGAAAVIDPASFAPRNGRIDLAPIEQVAPDVKAANTAVLDAAARLEQVDTSELFGPLRAPVSDLVQKVDEVGALTSTAAKAAELLPPMLGADGPRTYVVLAQNNAEPRALGGINGAVILLRANHGKITIREQRSASDFARPDDPFVRLTRAERALYGTQLASYMQNTTATPHFPRAARIARKMWKTVVGGRVDGVASIDPVALQMLLGATGPVALPGGQELNGENTAQFLLNQVYLDLEDPAAQDALFGVAARAVFEKVMAGAGDLPATTEAIAAATRQGRVMLWSARPAEQEVLEGTTLAGELLGDLDGSPVVGVYLHDRTAAKMGFYQRLKVQATATECHPDGGQKLRVVVTVSSTAPRNAAALPDYVTGAGAYVPRGVIATDVYLYAPTGATITAFKASQGGPGVVAHEYDGLQVVAKDVRLRPGASVRLVYSVSSPEDLPDEVRVRATPGPVETDERHLTSQCG